MLKQNFYFLGQAPCSKSLLNRALIVKSYFPDFKIHGTSQCEDIRIMTQAILDIQNHKTTFYCGLSATALRFLAVRMSRKKGQFTFTGEASLFKRPFKELQLFLSQLSVKTTITKTSFIVISDGWRFQGDSIHIASQTTSQQASAFLLNAWDLDQDLYICLDPQGVSYSYIQMSIKFLQNLGMIIKQQAHEVFIPKKQTLNTRFYTVEQDKSCLFALASFAALTGTSIFLNWDKTSLQPDHIFPVFLKQMGVTVEHQKTKLLISKSENLKAISVNLNTCPDIFPLLACLCAKAQGKSVLSGLKQQGFKESHRLHKIQELLKYCGIKSDIQHEECHIYGKKNWPEVCNFQYDVAQDHRMVMAAELLAFTNTPISICGKQHVNKSFPEFYNMIYNK